MKNALILISISIAIFTSQSCKKESQELISPKISLAAQNTDEVNVSTATIARRKDEIACTVDGRWGIKCYVSIGNTCKKTHDCTSVSKLGGEQFFTPSELQNFGEVDYKSNRDFMIHMWKIGWFHHPDELD